MAQFFIDRPIFAWVIALVIMLVGGLSILKLPINQYPSIAPPAIAIAVSYPGASAQTVQDTVVQVIEQYPETGKRVYQLVYAEFQKFLAQFQKQGDHKDPKELKLVALFAALTHPKASQIC